MTAHAMHPTADTDAGHDVAQLVAQVAQLEAQLAEHHAGTTPPPAPTDDIQDALDALSETWTATVRSIERVGRDRPHYYFEAEHRRTGEPVTVGPITEVQLDSPRVMRQKLYTALGGERGRQLTDPEHSEVLALIDRAAHVRDDGHDDAELWRERIRAGVAGAGSPIDLRDAERKRNTLTAAHWCFADTAGHTWVHVAGLAHHLRLRKHHNVDERDIAASLTHLAFDNRQLTWRYDGKNRSRRYWRSPAGFTDPEPTDDGAL